MSDAGRFIEKKKEFQRLDPMDQTSKEKIMRKRWLTSITKESKKKNHLISLNKENDLYEKKRRVFGS